MRYTVDGQLHLEDVPQGLFDDLRKALTVPNPAYQQAVRLGKPAYGIARSLMLYEVRNNELILPRGMAGAVWKHRPSNTSRLDCMVDGEALEWPESRITLRGYQQDAFDRVTKNASTQGVLVMPCGGGKTETGLAICRAIGRPVLWIAHTIDLCQQARARAMERLGLDASQVGMLGGGKSSIGTHITFATVQTLYSTDLDELAGRIGTVIVDECQHVCANPSTAQMFNAVLGMLPARHRYGLTATPTRGDGLEQTIYMVLGPKLAEVTQEAVEGEGGTVIPAVQPVLTEFAYKPGYRERETIDIQRLRRHMAESYPRSYAILGYLMDEINAGRTCIVLGCSLSLLEDLHNAVKDACESRFVCGATKAKDRQAALAELKAGDAQVLFATYQLAKEGLDIPRAERLFFVQPVKDAVAVQQAVGRIMRPHPEKSDALVYDFVDHKVPTCRRQYGARKNIYKKLKCTILEEI